MKSKRKLLISTVQWQRINIPVSKENEMMAEQIKFGAK